MIIITSIWTLNDFAVVNYTGWQMNFEFLVRLIEYVSI